MSECTVTCGGGTQYRYPILSQAPSKGGEPCPHFIIMNKTEKYQCNLHHCPGVYKPISQICMNNTLIYSSSWLSVEVEQLQ